MVIQLTGNATIIGSKTLSDEDKSRALAAKDGYVKVVRLTLVDSQGQEVVLEGRLYESQGGSLTSRIVFRTESCELVEVGEKQPAEKKDKAADLRKELGL